MVSLAIFITGSQRVGAASAGPAAQPALASVAQSSSWQSRLAFVRVTTNDHFNCMVTLALALVVITWVTENISPTAYGRFGGDAIIAVDPRVGWWLMELPVTFTFVYFFYIKGGSQSHELVIASLRCT
jgi:hypothetical protein